MVRQGSCKFNAMIDCANGMRSCGKCGWNPEVREKRIEKLNELEAKKQEVQICPK